MKTGPYLSLYSLYLASVSSCITSNASSSSIFVSVRSCSSSIKSSYLLFKMSLSFSGSFSSDFLTLTSSLSNSCAISSEASISSRFLFKSSIFCSVSCLKKLIASSFSSLLIDVTMYCAKYKTLSRFLGDTSNNRPNLEGVLFENQI